MDKTLLRIRQVFHESGKSQKDIGKMISKTSQYVWKLLNNDTIKPSDSVIKDICREFSVNEEWLRHGNGDTYIKSDDKLSAYVSQITDSDDDFIKDFIMIYMELDEDSKLALRKIADAMVRIRKERDL